MRIILIRHGNTFSAGENAVWIGARSDLNLVDKGRRQAEEAGRQIRQAGFLVTSIFAGPLRRTAETATIIAKIVGTPEEAVVADHRLTELDYGDWEGLTSAEIRTRYGNCDIDAWESSSRWPHNAGWPSTKDDVLGRLRSFFDEITQQVAAQENAVCLVVSSNGIFRLLAETLRLPPVDRKMATGNISVLKRTASNTWNVERWNVAPARLTAPD